MGKLVCLHCKFTISALPFPLFTKCGKLMHSRASFFAMWCMQKPLSINSILFSESQHEDYWQYKCDKVPQLRADRITDFQSFANTVFCKTVFIHTLKCMAPV